LIRYRAAWSAVSHSEGNVVPEQVLEVRVILRRMATALSPLVRGFRKVGFARGEAKVTAARRPVMRIMMSFAGLGWVSAEEGRKRYSSSWDIRL